MLAISATRTTRATLAGVWMDYECVEQLPMISQHQCLLRSASILVQTSLRRHPPVPYLSSRPFPSSSTAREHDAPPLQPLSPSRLPPTLIITLAADRQMLLALSIPCLRNIAKRVDCRVGGGAVLIIRASHPPRAFVDEFFVAVLLYRVDYSDICSSKATAASQPLGVNQSVPVWRGGA